MSMHSAPGGAPILFSRSFAAAAVAAAIVLVVVIAWTMHNSRESEEQEAATEVAVHVAPIVSTTMRSWVTAYGVIVARPKGDGPAASVRMAPSVPGVIMTVNCVEGQQVASGEVLFELDTRAADVAVQFAERSLQREEELWKVEGTSRQALQEAQRQLEAARVQKALLQLQSPIAGTVVRVNVSPGEAVDLSTVLAEVVDLDRLTASAGVPASELAELRVGQAAQVIPVPPAAPVEAKLDFIAYQVDPQTGLAELRVNLPPESGLRPGQTVTMRIVSAEHTDSLSVPEASIVHGADGSDRIAIVDGDVATMTEVRTGLRDSGMVEVEGEGLQAGMTVVTQGSYGLPDQTRIRVIATDIAN